MNDDCGGEKAHEKKAVFSNFTEAAAKYVEELRQFQKSLIAATKTFVILEAATGPVQFPLPESGEFSCEVEFTTAVSFYETHVIRAHRRNVGQAFADLHDDPRRH